MTAGLILEGMVAVLLAVTIVYCFRLNRRLAALRHGQSELHAIVLALNEATGNARAGIEQLRRSSITLSDDLSEKTRAGRALADELGMIVETGNSLADRLADGSTGKRANPTKPDPREALSRLDENFRRQTKARGAPSPEAGPATLKEGKDGLGDTSLRRALRMTR